MSETITLGRLLLDVYKLDVGQAKQQRIAAYVKTAFALQLQDKVDLQHLCKLSRKEIVEERRNLRN